MLLTLGDIVQLKKKHPCGSDEWKVVFVGSDVKLRCCGCDHVVMLDRPTFDKRCKRMVRKAEEKAEEGTAYE